MANVYPPSPALSACDSLADIENLDAFLEAQGKLSHWPTPPPVADKKPMSVTEHAVDYVLSDPDDGEDEDELTRLSSAFTIMATEEEDIDETDLDHVRMVIMRSEVPVEVLAVAYNILRAVRMRDDPDLPDNCFSHPDLTVVASVNLAMTFMEDKAPDSEYWARSVCKRIWSAHEIEKTVLNLLAQPEVRMLSLSSIDAINQTLVELRDITLGVVPSGGEEDVSVADVVVKEPQMLDVPEPLKLDISVSTQWLHGDVTPAETPVVEANSWLRLL